MVSLGMSLQKTGFKTLGYERTAIQRYLFSSTKVTP